MPWWTDIAIKHPGTPNHGGGMVEHRGVVIHIAEGSYQGTIAWQMNPDAEVSSHFIVSKSGEITQMLDTDVTAWTQGEGNGHWLSIENEGYTPNPLTDAQVTANAKIMAKSVAVYGHPMAIANSPSQKGLGHHSMGAENGYAWGHSECPGPNIKAQKPEILERAKGDDVSASDVWSWDVDPSGGRYSAAGAAWDTLNRTGYLANSFAPQVNSALTEIGADVTDIENALGAVRTRVSSMETAVADMRGQLSASTASMEAASRSVSEVRWLMLVVLIVIVAGAAGVITWAAAS